MNCKHLLVSLALIVFASSASTQTLPGLSDTVKITIINPVNEHHGGIRDGNFVARVLVSNDTAWIGATLGFTWGTKPEDSINWILDSVVLGPGIAAWTIPQIRIDTAAAQTLLGGIDIGAFPYGPGSDMVFADLYFSLKPGNTFLAGSDMIIDSTFVPPAGKWLGVTDFGDRAPRFTGAQKVTYNDIQINTGAPLPTTFSLSQNYPNPFNPSTKFEYTIPVKSDVSIVIYNALGQKVKTLHEGEQDAGPWIAKWDGKDDDGRKVASGVYFYKLKAGDFVQSRKMMLLK